MEKRREKTGGKLLRNERIFIYSITENLWQRPEKVTLVPLTYFSKMETLGKLNSAELENRRTKAATN